MEPLATIGHSITAALSIPILQLVGLVLVIGLAERIGIPVITTLKSLLKLDSDRELKADNRNALQPLLSQMETLSQHFNHETTDLLKTIVDVQKEEKNARQEIRTTQLVQCQKLDRMVDSLEDMQRNGIRIRK